MNVRGAVAVAILVLASGLAAAPPAVARDTGCPDEPVTLRDLEALYLRSGPLATRFPLGVGWINERGRACFGSTALRFRAFVNGTGGIGGASAYDVRPSWFLDPALIVFATDREVEPGQGEGPFYGIAVPPGFGNLQDRYHRQWVTVTAHFADPRAGSCRADGVPGETPSRRQAIRICRSMLVLVSIGPADGAAAPDTATGDVRHDTASGSRGAAPGGSRGAAPGGSRGAAPGGAWAALLAAAALSGWLWRMRMARLATPHAVSHGRPRRR